MIPPKMAIINDLSGYGRCSLTTALPIISAMQIQCCPIPTSIFSNHTGFPEWFCRDLTHDMTSYLDYWKKLSLTFDAIYSGYLGSSLQIEIVDDFITSQLANHPLILIDPVLGDHGKAYSRITPEHCLKMRNLLKHATIITPNLTEACLLTDIPYIDIAENPKPHIPNLMAQLQALGPKQIVITGITQNQHYINYIQDSISNSTTITNYQTPSVGAARSGTGDLFASIISAHCLNGHSLASAVEKASSFIALCIMDAEKTSLPIKEGVCFEKYLAHLIP